jgi:hypothetical protein
LGESPDLVLEIGSPYQTRDGITGKVTVLNPYVNIRLTWQMVGWSKPSIVQLRVIASIENTTVSFHQENLPDARTRETVRERWKRVMAEIENQILNSSTK